MHSLVPHKNRPMAKKQNPYQLWLGLNPKLTNPNLFQLLGVDPRSQDEAAIKLKAVASAKALLQKLKAVEAKNDTEKVFKQKLHAKIVLAHETMIAPDKRKKYLHALVANAAAQKKAAGTPGAVPPQTPVANQSTPNSPGPPASSLAPPSSPSVPPPPSTPNAGNPPANPSAEIPAAIPMAMPVSSTPVATNNNEEASGFSMVDASASQSGPNFDNLDAEPQVKVYAKKRKTSRSWVVPIVVLTLLVGGIGGLVSMMTKYSNIFELIPGLKEQVNVSQDGPNVPNAPSPTVADGSSTQSLRVPETPKHAIDYKGDEEPDMAIPAGGMPPLIESKDDDSMTERKSRKKKRRESGIARKESGEKDQTQEKKADVKNSMSEKMQTLDDSRLSSIRLGLQRSRDALFRQDRGVAKHFNDDVKELLKRYKVSNARSVTPEQQGLIRAVDTNQQVIGWMDDFWEQVKSSSIETAGGDTIKLGDKTMALVEATEEDIVLRVAGQNERIRYSNLTPMLAITLGERGTKESVPRWNLAQAAYLGVMAEQYDHLKQQQYRILNQVKMDGFDIESEAISDYTEPDWLKLGLPEKKLAPFSDDQFDELIAVSRKRLGYEDPSSVPIERVDELIYKLTLNLRKDPAIRVSRLWEAVAMIKKGHRVWDLMFVNRELNNCCAEVDFNKSFVGPIEHIAEKAKDHSFQDQIARITINFVKEFDGNPNLTPVLREKLVRAVGKIAKDLQSNQLAAMAEQLSAASK